MRTKTGVKKAWINQLDTAGYPHYLGDHVIKYLVTGQYLAREHKLLAVPEEIRVVELPGNQDRRRPPFEEEQRLVNSVTRALDGH